MRVYTTVAISNKLTKAEWGLALPEYRVMTALLHRLYKSRLLDLDNYITIDINQYANTYGLSPSTTYRDFKELLKNGMSRQCTLREGTEVTLWNYIRSIRYNEDGSYKLEVLFEKNLADVLIPDVEKGNYTKLKLQHGKCYSSLYTTVLHRILREQSFTGSCILSLVDIRRYLSIPDGDYKTFSNFNNRVLKPAIKELNEITDMSVRYIKFNPGKATTDIKFTMGVRGISKAAKDRKRKAAERGRYNKELDHTGGWDTSA